MNRLFLECNMGVAGDMLAGALYELLTESQQHIFLEKVQNIGIDGVKVQVESVAKCGIYGTHIRVLINGKEEESVDVPHHHSRHSHDHDHHHSHDHDHNHEDDHHHSHDHDYNHEDDHHHSHDHAHFTVLDVKNVVKNLSLSEKVKKDIVAVYEIIAQAEAKSHKLPIDLVHFHEVGQIDAIVDVAMSAILFDLLDVDLIQSSPINTGKGNVKCAHGILPVPAPATAHILQTIPNYANHIEGELATPTGVAILKHFVNEFISHRPTSQPKVGYGMGTKDFDQANCVRAFLSQEEDITDLNIVELSCNIDDMTPEALGFAMDMLLDLGALDVYITNIQMKKNRPGFVLTVTCRESDLSIIRENIFKHTTTIGIKDYRPMRYALKRDISEETTSFGPVRIKKSQGYGVHRQKYEYDDLKKIAIAENLSLEQVKNKIQQDKES